MAFIVKGEQGYLPCSFFVDKEKVNKRLYEFEREFISIIKNIKEMIIRSIRNE